MPDPKYFMGRGKGDEIRQAVENLSADFLVFNHELSPSGPLTDKITNLEKQTAWLRKVFLELHKQEEGREPAQYFNSGQPV